jgi:hypothetical protein
VTNFEVFIYITVNILSVKFHDNENVALKSFVRSAILIRLNLLQLSHRLIIDNAVISFLRIFSRFHTGEIFVIQNKFKHKHL